MILNKIKHLVFTSDLKDKEFIKVAYNSGVDCHLVIDARSAVYIATGITAQNQEKVIVCVRGSNESRSAFSGMTEAFYRNLPIILVTYGEELDYSIEINDAVNRHIIIENETEIENYLSIGYPLHIEVKESCDNIKKINSDFVSIVARSLSEKNYLYLSNNFISDFSCSCKLVRGGMPNCYEGALSNVLGASLAKIHDKYVGVFTEEEFIHDMNALGNINVNNLLFYIVYVKNNQKLISEYSKSLGFVVKSVDENDLDSNLMKSLLTIENKALLIVNQEI